MKQTDRLTHTRHNSLFSIPYQCFVVSLFAVVRVRLFWIPHFSAHWRYSFASLFYQINIYFRLLLISNSSDDYFQVWSFSDNFSLLHSLPYTSSHWRDCIICIHSLGCRCETKLTNNVPWWYTTINSVWRYWKGNHSINTINTRASAVFPMPILETTSQVKCTIQYIWITQQWSLSHFIEIYIAVS